MLLMHAGVWERLAGGRLGARIGELLLFGCAYRTVDTKHIYEAFLDHAQTRLHILSRTQTVASDIDMRLRGPRFSLYTRFPLGENLLNI